MSRNFTYVDDIVGGMLSIVNAFKNETIQTKYKLYNIGNSKPVKLLDFIESLEKATGIKATKTMLPMQPGDVEKTWADTQELTEDFSYKPDSDIDFGVKEFVKWYKEYYQK